MVGELGGDEVGFYPGCKSAILAGGLIQEGGYPKSEKKKKNFNSV